VDIDEVFSCMCGDESEFNYTRRIHYLIIDAYRSWKSKDGQVSNK
jgi:hypothetical protein